ncbi:MAG: NAD(P)/FAD-dependent oxidoreductase [Deltaproteobacteria bacterium]|nr:NAD(P)/FAD-dependent oxidoreductase [Deltaproteobacteria bacterium]
MPNFKYESKYQYDPSDPFGHMQEEFPDESEFDVAIIGGGPNGLIAAAYLAKAGLSVVVCERRFEAGGGLATEENLFPCYASNPHVLYHMMVDYMPAIRDFDLDGPSLTWIQPNAQTGMVFEDGSSVMLTRQVNDTKDSISKYSYKDANSFGKVVRDWKRIVGEILAPATYLPPMAPLDITIAMERTELGRKMLDYGEETPLDIICGTFEHDKVRTLMLYAACMWGLDPNESGLGFMVPLLLDRCMNKRYCYGGSHKFAGALARQVVQNGGLILEAAAVDKILVEKGRAVGVRIAHEGRIIKSKAVMSTLDPHSTFLDFIDEGELSAEFRKEITGWEWDKWSFNTIHVATDEPPRYACDDPWIDKCFATVLGIESVDHLLAHWDAVVGGRLDPQLLGGHSTCESLFDPTLSDRPDKYVSMFQIHAPYDIEGGWLDQRKRVEEAMMAKWSKAAPNLTPDKIVAASMEDPEEIEIRFPQMRRGSIKHGDYGPLQMGCFRPNQDCSDSRTPIEGLYTCGASTYPGGLVLGGPGYIGAGTVADDLGVERWWKPTSEMERYIKTYLEE